MSKERINPNFDLESCLRNKVNEAKIYLEDKHKRQKDEPCEESSYAESFIYYFQNVETILDLYKQEKEKNKILEELLQGRLFELYNYYKNLAGSYQANSISKDKIKEKIEELEDAIEPWGDEDLCYQLKIKDKAQIEVLKELLEEE